MTNNTLTKQQLKLNVNKKQSGRFFVGDLGYSITDIDVWRDKFVSQMFFGTKEGNQGILTVDGYNYFVANTGGDGIFPCLGDVVDDVETRQEIIQWTKDRPDEVDYLPVDAGCLGVIPMELVTEDEDELIERGIIVDLGLDGSVDELPISFVPGLYFNFAGMEVVLDITVQFDLGEEQSHSVDASVGI